MGRALGRALTGDTVGALGDLRCWGGLSPGAFFQIDVLDAFFGTSLGASSGAVWGAFLAGFLGAFLAAFLGAFLDFGAAFLMVLSGFGPGGFLGALSFLAGGGGGG